MKTVVAKIVAEIKPGVFFDSHFVISQIIKHHSDAYIHFAGPAETTAQMHGRIAQLIGKALGKEEPVSRKALSEHIHGKPNYCALWQKT